MTCCAFLTTLAASRGINSPNRSGHLNIRSRLLHLQALEFYREDTSESATETAFPSPANAGPESTVVQKCPWSGILIAIISEDAPAPTFMYTLMVLSADILE